MAVLLKENNRTHFDTDDINQWIENLTISGTLQLNYMPEGEVTSQDDDLLDFTVKSWPRRMYRIKIVHPRDWAKYYMLEALTSLEVMPPLVQDKLKISLLQIEQFSIGNGWQKRCNLEDTLPKIEIRRRRGVQAKQGREKRSLSDEEKYRRIADFYGGPSSELPRRDLHGIEHMLLRLEKEYSKKRTKRMRHHAVLVPLAEPFGVQVEVKETFPEYLRRLANNLERRK